MRFLAYLNYALLFLMVVSIFVGNDKAIDISSDLFKNALSGFLAIMLNDKD